MRDAIGSEPEPGRGDGRLPEDGRLPGGGRMPAGQQRPTVQDVVPQGTPTVRIAARDRWPIAWAGLIGLFLGGALLKPWDEPSRARPSFEPAAVIRSAPDSSIGPDPQAGLREHCQEPIGWRVYSRELWIGRPVRTWRSLEPVARASGPADPVIPVVPLGPSVEALGYCSPWTGPERPPDDARIAGWRHDVAAGGDALTAVPLRSIAPDDVTTLGALFGAIAASRPAAAPSSDPATSPGTAAATATGWPAGRYVFALRATDWERWWAVQVAAPDVAGPDAGSSGTRPAASPASP